jgi:hypothetical protein
MNIIIELGVAMKIMAPHGNFIGQFSNAVLDRHGERSFFPATINHVRWTAKSRIVPQAAFQPG